jgi:5,10-methylenetetrahydromethanopterin reductase
MRQMVSYFGPYLEAPALAAIGLRPEDFADISRCLDQGLYEQAAAMVTDEMTDLAIRGTPQDVIQRIETIAAMGVTQVSLGGPLGPDPEEAIRLMGEQVIPYFRA